MRNDPIVGFDMPNQCRRLLGTLARFTVGDVLAPAFEERLLAALLRFAPVG
jgi:hypothetical protein